MRCCSGDISLSNSVNFVGLKNSKSIPTKSLIDRCENVINYKVISKNTITRDCSFNVYRPRKITFEDRVVEDSKQLLLTNMVHGAGLRQEKTGHVYFGNRRNWNLKLPIPY